MPDFTETSVEVLGAESTYGAAGRASDAREVILKIAVRHNDKDALRVFAREIYPAATAMAQGLTGFAGGRPDPQPVIRLFSFLVDKADVPVEVEIGGRRVSVPVPAGAPDREEAVFNTASPSDPLPGGETVTVPLLAIAHGRSGDKGDIANIGILARRPEYLPAIRGALTAEAVRDYFAHIVTGRVERFEWPGLHGFNFMLHGGLGGGGIASLRHDPQGKTYAQMLLDMTVDIPVAWLDSDASLAKWSKSQNRQEEYA